jgi:hypothetical protein
MKRIVLSVCIFTLGACGESNHLFVPSDPKANYYVLEIAGSRSERSITTKRVGTSGESFSKRVYNCEKSTVRYLGTGSTLREMKISKSESRMSPVVYKSIAYYVGDKACK